MTLERFRRDDPIEARRRGWITEAPALAAQARDAGAVERDRAAAARDVAAGARDGMAEARDTLAASRDAADRKLKAAGRQRAEASRQDAARDRALARRDREDAAADRVASAHELACEGLDYLTGALRRRIGLAAMAREVERAERTGDPLVVAFLDVNGLKAINDGRGHLAGDELLRGIVKCIGRALRPYDVVMRFGGDEFVCSLSGQTLDGARARFDQIGEAIADRHDGATLTVGLVERRAGESVDDLVARSDVAMMAQRARR